MRGFVWYDEGEAVAVPDNWQPDDATPPPRVRLIERTEAGQREAEGGAAPGLALECQFAAHQRSQHAADREPQPGTRLGLPAVSDAGDPLGVVCAVENFGATDVIEIEKPDGKRFMVPLTPVAVPEWNAEKLVVSKDFADT